MSGPYTDPYGLPPPGDIAESVLPPEQRRPMPPPEPLPRADTPPTEQPAPVAAQPAALRPAGPLEVHHVGVAVHSIDDAMRFWGEKLGLDVVDRQDLPDRALKVAFVQAGNTLVELLEPTSPSSTVARFLERRGPGLHHLCFGTPDIVEHLRDLRDKGVQMVDDVPRPGAHGDVAFLHPGAAFGVLVELLQAPPDESAPGTTAAGAADVADAAEAAGEPSI